MSMGWRPNISDDRDWDYGQIATRTPIKSKVDLTSTLPHYLLQGNAPSCVGHAIAHQLWCEESSRSLYRTSVPSRGYIWAMARASHQANIQMTGTYPRLAYKAVQKLGCPPESKWPYRKSTYCTMPNDVARRWAMSRRGLQYYTIKQNRSDAIRQALTENHPVTIGTRVFPAMRKYKRGEILHRPFVNEQLNGGHYMCIMGYEQDHFIVVNSWRGKEVMLFHEDIIEWSKSGDFTVVTGWA